MTPEERFMAKVSPVPFCGCWLWAGACTGDEFDYGSFWFEGRVIRAHLASWRIFVGPIPEGVCVLHKCDVPACVHPAHLFLGSKQDNTADMWAKGRQDHTQAPRGEAHWRTPFDARAILTIRDIYAAGACSQRELGILFGVRQPAIQRIVSKRRWAHL